jgi:DNA-binding XRE family transcriptional regulator
MALPARRIRDAAAFDAALDAAGMSVSDLAATAGVTRQFISLLRRGRRRCSPTVAAAISEALGTPTLFMPALFDLSDNKEPSVSITALDDPWLNFEDVADLANMSPATLRHLRHEKKGPPFKRVGKRLKIRRSAAEQWIEEYDASE